MTRCLTCSKPCHGVYQCRGCFKLQPIKRGGRPLGFSPDKDTVPREGTRLRTAFDLLQSGKEIDVSFVKRAGYRRAMRLYLQDRYGLDITVTKPRTWRLAA